MITGATGSYARGHGHINLSANTVSGILCQANRWRGRDSLIVMTVKHHLGYHSHYANMWGYPGNVMKITVRVKSSTDANCAVGTVGHVTLFASYSNGVRSDSVQFFFPTASQGPRPSVPRVAGEQPGPAGVTAGAPRTLLDGLGFPESTRWHEGRVWLCNWGSGEVLAVDDEGRAEVMARVAPSALPFSIDWHPDGTLLIVDGPRRLLLAQQPDGSLETFADLTGYGEARFNELVVDDRGNAFVNGGPGLVVRVGADGIVHEEASGLRWPNGMAIVDDGATLVVADSHAEQLVGFAIEDDGSLSNRHVWADVEYAPDGICADAEGAVWVASVPGRALRQGQSGGEVLDTVAVDRGCFACMLGGVDGQTLFIAAAVWRGMDVAMREGPGIDRSRCLAAPDQPALPRAAGLSSSPAAENT